MRIMFFLILASAALASTTIAQAQDTGYGINAGDTLGVFVWNEESLARELLVGPDGTISFPMVGTLSVRGLSTAQIGEKVSEGLGQYLRDKPLVTVSLIGVQGNQIYVLGAVNQPGAYIATRQLDVAQALSLAGGLGVFAKEAEIKVIRRTADGTLQKYPFNFTRFKSGENLESNVLLQSGDLVVVP